MQSKAELIQSRFTFDTRLKITLKLPELNNHRFGQVSKVSRFVMGEEIVNWSASLTKNNNLRWPSSVFLLVFLSVMILLESLSGSLAKRSAVFCEHSNACAAKHSFVGISHKRSLFVNSSLRLNSFNQPSHRLKRSDNFTSIFLPHVLRPWIAFSFFFFRLYQEISTHKIAFSKVWWYFVWLLVPSCSST